MIQWLRNNYGWQAKGKLVVFLMVAVIFIIALLYMAETGAFRIL